MIGVKLLTWFIARPAMIPLLMLGIAFALLVAVGTAYRHGYKIAAADCVGEAKKVQDKAIITHNENAAIDMQAAYEAGKQEAVMRTKVVTLTNEVEKIIYEKPAPADCRMQPDAFRLFNLSIAIANGETNPGAAVGVPDNSAKTPVPAKP